MIVVDASVILEVLLRSDAASAAEERIFVPGRSLHAPHLIDVEIAQVLRRYAAHGAITGKRGQDALDDLAGMSIRRYGHAMFFSRIWELRNNVTAYDATYIALAEVLDAPLITRDRRLASAAGNSVEIELV